MTNIETPAPVHFEAAPRPLFQAMRRGFFCRCPNCGRGGLFYRFLKPVPECSVCGEDLSHQRADDAPPYFTMMIVGHLLVPIIFAIQIEMELSIGANLAIWLPVTALATVALLQPVKGAIIGLQWALRMHGFDGLPDPDRYDGMLGAASTVRVLDQSAR